MMPMTADDLRTRVAHRTQAQLDLLPTRIRDAGLPDDATVVSAIGAACAVEARGVAQAVAQFQARPPIQSEDEAEALLTLVSDLVDSAIASVIAAWQDRAGFASARARERLRVFNAERREAEEPSEYAVQKQLRVRYDGTRYDPIDTEHFEREDLGDGRFRITYPIRRAPDA